MWVCGVVGASPLRRGRISLNRDCRSHARRNIAIKIKPQNKGKLHSELGVKPGEKIPAKKLAKAAQSKNPVERKRAVFAENARKWRK